MNNTINTLESALIMDLEMLYCGEQKLKTKLPQITRVIKTEKIRNAFEEYIEGCADKILKMERIFSYLNHEPKSCAVSVMNEMIDEVFNHVAFASESTIQDLLVINCLQRINGYKISLYKSCFDYAAELELDIPTELLSTILKWEHEIECQLSELSVSQLNTCAITLGS